jgi:uncharacterized DUF497 family protein
MCSYTLYSAFGFDWDEANIQHIARHQVEPAEAEEAFAGRNAVARSSEGRYVLFGRSAAGRYLSIVFIVRSGVVRVITARSMTPAERKRMRRS